MKKLPSSPSELYKRSDEIMTAKKMHGNMRAFVEQLRKSQKGK